MIDLSLELLRKYNVQGPRYTSYPPAPSWKVDIGPSDYEAQIEKSNKASKSASLSLYFHLPFCEQLCYFCGCTTLITGKNRSFEQPYLEAILKETDWLASCVDIKRPVVQLHLGGGTPTYSSPETLERLMDHVQHRFRMANDAELGVEIDPRVTTKDHLTTLRRLGFNRLSMGVQDFDPHVQKAINRLQPFEDTDRLVKEARSLGFSSINIDLIYGLPYQTPASFQTTIKKILEIGPDRLAVYSYAHVPWLKKQQDVFAAHLPSEDVKFEIFRTALNEFTSAGFEYIGMDHFARPGDELAVARRNRTLWRNFQGYTTKAGTDLFGLGMSAISHVQGAYFQNHKEIKPYEAAIQKGGPATARGFQLSDNDRIRYRVIQNLLCHAVVVKSEIETEFGLTFDDYFSDALQKLKPLEADGLVRASKKGVEPTALGRVFLRNIAMAFDAYLPKAGEKPIFSKTV